MEKGKGKGTDTLQTTNDFTRKEYIEREAAKRVVDDIDTWASGWRDYAKLQMDSITAADVVPVRHGRWTGHDIGNGRLSIDWDTCSLCGSRFYQIAETGCDWNYCPNCGALMDKDGDRE